MSTSRQAAALQIADDLERLLPDWTVAHLAATELRRQHANLSANYLPDTLNIVTPSTGDVGDDTTRDQYKRMFHAACSALGEVNEALGLDPDDGGAEPILAAIAELKAKTDGSGDTAILDWLSDNLLAADFAWGDPATPVIVIEIPKTAGITGDLRRDVLAIMAKQGGAA